MANELLSLKDLGAHFLGAYEQSLAAVARARGAWYSPSRGEVFCVFEETDPLVEREWVKARVDAIRVK